MIFDFFGARSKAIIAMAHIGALPGAPGYDADGGVDKLIEGVLADVEKLQAGGVDAIMFGNENDRPYVLKAPPEGIAAFAAIVERVKPHLKVPFGVNYLWDPAASVAIGARDRRQVRARDLHRRLRLRHGPLGARLRQGGPAPPRAGPRRHEAAVQHQRRVRSSARPAADRAARAKRGVLVAGRRHPRLRPDHRPAGRSVGPAQGSRDRAGRRRSSPIRA